MMNILPQGFSQRSKLDKLQASIAAIDAELEQVRSAELAPDDALAVIDRTLDKEAESARAMLRAAAHGNDRVISQRDVVEGGTYRVTPLGLVACLFGRETIRQQWLAVIEADVRYRPGLPAAEREKKLEALQASRAKLEHEEELEALRIEDATGALVLRRADIDVNLLLELWR